VKSKPTKFSLRDYHNEYCSKLKELGDLLGHDTKIPKTGLYHLAYPDAAWYVDAKVVPEKVPLVVFEVLCSESEKAIRGSVSSILLYGSPIGILVLVTEMYKHFRNKDLEGWKKYVTELVKTLGLERRIFLWDETKVDHFLEKVRNDLKVRKS